MTFPKFVEDFDPSDQKEYTWKFRLREGEGILQAHVDPVDETSTDIVDSPLVFGPISFGLDSANIWGVTQWLLPMVDPTLLVQTTVVIDPVAPKFMAYLRCMITTDFAQPMPHEYTRTMRLWVRQT